MSYIYITLCQLLQLFPLIELEKLGLSYKLIEKNKGKSKEQIRSIINVYFLSTHMNSGFH